MWTNCRLYNPPGHAVRMMGDRLSDAWEKKWHAGQIESKWEALIREEKEDEVRPAAGPRNTSHDRQSAGIYDVLFMAPMAPICGNAAPPGLLPRRCQSRGRQSSRQSCMWLMGRRAVCCCSWAQHTCHTE